MPHRIQGCCRWRQAGKQTVEVLHIPKHKRARYGNLQTCGSVWNCPVCSAKITERRRLELTLAVAKWREQGGAVVMVTYTLRHKGTDGLAALLGHQQSGSRKGGSYRPPTGLMGARGMLTSGRRGQEVYNRHSVAGSVRCLEVTWGAQNGWHPHIHELLFVPASYDRAALLVDLRRQWDGALRLVGGREVNDHGVEVSDTYERIEEYVTKFGHEPAWTVEHEMTKQAVKVGRDDARMTPMQLLAYFADTGDVIAGERFTEYAFAMHGRRLLYWSSGLRAKLLPDLADLTDEEVAEDALEDAVLLASLDMQQWGLVLACEAQGELLNVADGGDAAAVASFLVQLAGRVSPIPGELAGRVEPARDVATATAGAGRRS